MAPPAWAYQVEHYDPPPDDEFVCSICRAVFCDPRMTPCKHVFCRACIHRWLDHNSCCPICRKRMSRREIVHVVPLIKSLICKLSLRCHNAVRGCKEKLNLDRSERHEKECEFQLLRCKNKPCTVKLMRKDIPDHLRQCPHHYQRCKTCSVKVSTLLFDQHNCVKSLQIEMRAMQGTLKERDQKIKELEDEIKDLKANHYNYNRYAFDSDQSDRSSISADDVIIDLPTISASSDPLESDYLTDDEDDSPFWLSTSDILEGLESSFRRRGNRTSGPTVGDVSNVVAVDAADSTFDEEPRMRRPAKRRHPTRVLDTSDEDDEALEQPSLPSPKRSWQLFARDGGSTSQSASQQTYTDVTSPSTSHASSSRPSNSSAPVSKSKTSYKLKPKLNQPSQSNMQGGDTLRAPRSTAFERTLSLLEQYNLDSDPEWLPSGPRRGEVSEESMDDDGVVLEAVLTSSDESSLSDSTNSSSDSSYEDAPDDRHVFSIDW